MKVESYVNMTDKELSQALADKKAELFNLRFTHATGNLTNPLALKECKRDIARINTVLRERELGLSKGPVNQNETKKAAKVATKKVATKARG